MPKVSKLMGGLRAKDFGFGKINVIVVATKRQKLSGFTQRRGNVSVMRLIKQQNALSFYGPSRKD